MDKAMAITVLVLAAVFALASIVCSLEKRKCEAPRPIVTDKVRAITWTAIIVIALVIGVSLIWSIV